MSKYALSTQTQEIIVAKYIIKHGSVNRYEADNIGVCSLAARIKGLRYKGYKIQSHREKAIDLHGLKHNGISRYWFDLKNMGENEQEKLFKLLGQS